MATNLSEQSGWSWMKKNKVLQISLELQNFLAADIVNRLVKLPHDVETIKNIQRLGCPHIAANELELCTTLLADHPLRKCWTI